MRSLFPRNIISVEYKLNDNICSYNLIIKIILNMYGVVKTKEELKNKLISLYKKYAKTPQLFKNIKNIWKTQGKWSMASMLQEVGDFSKLIDSEKYYLTNIDLWLFSISPEYNIPLILVSGTTLRENTLFTIENKIDNIFVCNNTENDAYYFVQSSGIIKNTPPVYKLYMIDNNPSISIIIMSPELQEYISRTKGIISIDKFIEKGNLLKGRNNQKIKLVLE